LITLGGVNEVVLIVEIKFLLKTKGHINFDGILNKEKEED
jgi:hypothetical protein